MTHENKTQTTREAVANNEVLDKVKKNIIPTLHKLS